MESNEDRMTELRRFRSRRRRFAAGFFLTAGEVELLAVGQENSRSSRHSAVDGIDAVIMFLISFGTAAVDALGANAYPPAADEGMGEIDLVAFDLTRGFPRAEDIASRASPLASFSTRSKTDPVQLVGEVEAVVM